ncbi:MAG: M48 family metalloprotease [Candidatus Zophobacter franzmannii]|nr:M48 family metalloprotease [Candidatus Zophobacter franzmannii]
MKRLMLLILLFVLTVSLLSYMTEGMRSGVIMREGPGSYYPSIGDVVKGASIDVISQEDGWLKVSCPQGTGWVAHNAIETCTEMSSSIQELANAKTDLISSPATESAGIKGLAETYCKEYNNRPVDINYIADYKIDPKAFKKFYKKTYKGINLKKIRKKTPIPPRNSANYFTKNEQAFGLAVASAIAGNGIYKNAEITQYLNFVGNNIVAASDMPDVRFRFFVLNTNKLGAWSCPGGYIFVTAGLLKLLDNEAELASVLAHEVAHVSRKHGMSHYEMGEAKASAGDAFSRLDTEMEANFGTNKDAAKTEQELNEETKQLFNTILEGMLDEFEIEADYLGAVYTVRAGYSPEGFKSMLLKIQANLNRKSNNHFSKANISTRRLGSIDKSLKKIKAPHNLLYLRDRYEEMRIKL